MVIRPKYVTMVGKTAFYSLVEHAEHREFQHKLITSGHRFGFLALDTGFLVPSFGFRFPSFGFQNIIFQFQIPRPSLLKMIASRFTHFQFLILSFPFFSFLRTPSSQAMKKYEWNAVGCKPSSPFKPKPGTQEADIEGIVSFSFVSES